MICIVKITYVAFYDIRPMTDRFHLLKFVIAQGIARMAVPFDNCAMLNIIAGKTKRQSSRPCE